jgi:hypothetical protein
MITGLDEKKNQVVHAMYIKDIQKYTKLHICPKCGYIPPATDRGSYNKERFEKLVENCEKKIKKSLCPNEQFISFVPHIQKNPVYSYLLAYNQRSEYRVIQEYITYDFETVMKKEIFKNNPRNFFLRSTTTSICCILY